MGSFFTFLGRALCLLAVALLPVLARAGTPVVTLQATAAPAAGLDVTAFVDQVEVLNAATGAVVASAVPNAGFETADALTYGTYGYNPTGASWAFAGNSGIATNGSTFGAPPAPEGKRVAFLQTTSGGASSISQTLPGLAAGYYQLRLRLAQRNTTAANQGVAVLINGVEVARAVPANDNAFHVLTTAAFPIDQLTLSLQGLGSPSGGADVTAFVDQLQLSGPGSPALANASFENTGSLGGGSYGYNPTGASWTFSGNSGIATNGSAFGNPTAPDGTHVALLQSVSNGNGSLAQPLPPLAAGSYTLAVQAAQRNYTTADQRVGVYANQTLLGTLAPPNDGAFHAYSLGLPVALPAISGASPATATVGTVISLTGTNFGGAAYVSADGVLVVPTNVSSTGLSFVLPVGTGPSPRLVVTTPYGPSAAYTSPSAHLAVTSTNPVNFAAAAPVAGSAVAVTLSGAPTAASAAGLAVFSAQAGGRKAGTVAVSGNTATFGAAPGTATTDFRPGELVQVTVPATVQDANGVPAAPYAFQFRAASLAASATLGAVTSYASAGGAESVALGDVTGDGLPDMVLTTNTSAVLVRPATTAGTFGAPVSYAINTSTNGNSQGYSVEVALGDLNNDGRLDIVATDLNSTKLAVLLAQAGGGFAPYVSYSLPNTATALTLADLNGDGWLDVATGWVGLYVLLNQGNGSLGPATAYVTGQIIRGIAASDLNQDGRLDLAVTYNNSAGSVAVLLGQGGSFGPATAYPTGTNTYPYGLALGDVTGDGLPDAVVAADVNGNALVLLPGLGGGAFGSPQAISIAPAQSANGIALADLNGDGRLDVAVAGGSLAVLLGQAGGGFAPATNYSMDPSRGARSVAVADVNGDGALDVVTANDASSSSASVRLGVPTYPLIGSLSPASGPAGTTVVLTGSRLGGASAVTVNGVRVVPTNITDTGLTFVVPAGASPTPALTVTTPAGTGSSSAAFAVVLQASSFNPAANARTAPLAGSAVAVTYTEPVAAASVAGLAVFSTQVGGRKVGAVSVSGATASFAATSGTPRTDFKPGEVVSVSLPAAQNTAGLAAPKRVYQFTTAVGGTGRGNFAPPQSRVPNFVVYSTPTQARLADVDGDGDLDLLSFASGNNQVQVSYNNGQGKSPTANSTAFYTIGNTLTDLAVGDVDGDGDLDLVATDNTPSNGSGTVSVRLNSGTGKFVAPATNASPAVGTNPAGVALGDVDGDGDLDLLTANNTSAGTVSVRLNNGTGSFTAPATGAEVAVGNNPSGLTLGDVDGDGDLDLLAANGGSNSVSVRLNDGTGNFTVPPASPEVAVGNNPGNVVLGDVDSDGDLDLLTANSGSNSVSVRLNDGAGRFSAPTTTPEVAVSGSLYGLVLGDIDADGDLDLLTANGSTMSVRVNDGTGSFTGNDLPTTSLARGIALGDLDGDGDLDVLTVDGSLSAFVRFNQPLPVLSSVAPGTAAPAQSLLLSGSQLAGTTSVSFTNTATGAVTVEYGVRVTSSTVYVSVPASLPTGAYTVAVTTNSRLSNALPLTVCAITANVQSASATLASTGTATVPASAFDNGSTSGCGALTATAGMVTSTGTFSQTGSDNAILTFTVPTGAVITQVSFASYGTPSYNASTNSYGQGSCHAPASQAVVESYALYHSGTISIPVNSATFGGDPCSGTTKSLVLTVTYAYATPAATLSVNCANLGTTPVLLTLTTAGGASITRPTTLAVATPTLSTTTWTGATSTDWADCTNWSYGLLPTAGLDVSIPAGLSNYPAVPAGALVATRSLNLAAGASLALPATATLAVYGSLSSALATPLSGTVAFLDAAGSPATATINCPGGLTNAQVNKTLGNALTLAADLPLSGTLNDLAGGLATGSYTLQLGPAATLSETAAGYVTGVVQTTRDLSTAGATEPFGGLGLTLAPSGGILPGSTLVRRTTGTALRGAGASQSVQRYFDIHPTVTTGLNVALTLTARADELGGIAPANLRLFKSDDYGITWQLQSAATVSSAAASGSQPATYTASLGGVGSFSRWTLGDAAAPLTVELTAFTATAAGTAAVRLAWATASEVNSARFDVERSLDGVSFARLGQVAAAGSSTVAHSYTFTDAALPAGASPLYYRLRQVDLDGTARYSPVRVVALASPGLTLYPNPTHNRVTLGGASAGAPVQVLDAVGRVVLTATADATGAVQLTLPPGLASGVYVVRSGAQARRLTVE